MEKITTTEIAKIMTATQCLLSKDEEMHDTYWFCIKSLNNIDNVMTLTASVLGLLETRFGFSEDVLKGKIEYFDNMLNCFDNIRDTLNKKD